jgi:hypothetical protein
VLGREINTIYLRDYTNTPYGENIMGKVSWKYAEFDNFTAHGFMQLPQYFSHLT